MLQITGVHYHSIPYTVTLKQHIRLYNNLNTNENNNFLNISPSSSSEVSMLVQKHIKIMALISMLCKER